MDRQIKCRYERTRQYKVTDGIETKEVKSCSNGANKRGTVKRLGGNRYMVASTGEIKTYKAQTTEEQRKAGMARKLAALRALLRVNMQSRKDLFVSLTYAEMQTDSVKMQEDVERCMRRLRRKHTFDYIIVPEYQGNGRWHVHVIIIGDNIYISHDELAKAWGRGNVHVSRVRDANKVTQYLGANCKQKQIMRNDYPKNMRLYRCSRGIKRPDAKIVNGEELVNELEGCTQIYHGVYKDSAGYWHSTTVYHK